MRWGKTRLQWKIILHTQVKIKGYLQTLLENSSTTAKQATKGEG